MKAGSEEDARRRQRKTNGAEREADFLAEMICYRTSDRTARDATDQSATRRPSDACRVEMKPLTQVADGTADYDVVVTEEESTAGGNAGGNDQRETRMRLDRRARQIIALAVLTLPALRWC